MEYIAKDFIKKFVREQNKLLVREIGEILDKRFAEVDARFDKVEARLDKVETRLDGVEMRLGIVENRLDKMDMRFEEIDRHFGQIDRNFAAAYMRMEEMEENMARIVNKAFQEMRGEMDVFRQEMVLKLNDLGGKLDRGARFASDFYQDHERRIKVLEAAA